MVGAALETSGEILRSHYSFFKAKGAKATTVFGNIVERRLTHKDTRSGFVWFFLYHKTGFFWGAWVAQSGKCLTPDSGSGLALRVLSLDPKLGSILGVEPTLNNSNNNNNN